MAVKDQSITDNYAIYCGDCVEVMTDLPDASVDLTVYSPPFAGLYQYSSDPRDMSNCIDKDEFFEHYAFCVQQLARITKPGRVSAVHCMDIPLSNAGCDEMFPLPDEIRRIHKAHGFAYGGMRAIWKEPLMVRNRTMMKSLHHKTLCEDSTKCSIANADFLLMFRRTGENKVPVSHDIGLLDYAGERQPPAEVLGYRGMKGDQKKNLYSQWCWRNYASSVWMDIRVDRVLPHLEAKDDEDEKHVHPLQLDVVERACVLWSNPGEVVLTPYMGVGSECYGAILNSRRAIGVELKPSYYNQAVRNLQCVKRQDKEEPLFAAPKDTLMD
ncbi:MAG: DNA methyltransferase [Dehalococcoidia bacterium]|jgi:DNA modification methylase